MPPTREAKLIVLGEMPHDVTPRLMRNRVSAMTYPGSTGISVEYLILYM